MLRALAGQPPVHIVVRAEDCRDPPEDLRFVPLDPAQLRDHQLLVDAVAGLGDETGLVALAAELLDLGAVVGITTLEVDTEHKQMTVKGRTFVEGDVVSLDGTTGEVFAGEVPTMVPEFDDPYWLVTCRQLPDGASVIVMLGSDKANKTLEQMGAPTTTIAGVATTLPPVGGDTTTTTG